MSKEWVVKIHGAKCTFCDKPAKLDGWVTDAGIGYAPNCWSTHCEAMAEAHAFKQSQAIAQHDSKEPATYTLYVPRWGNNTSFEGARTPRRSP